MEVASPCRVRAVCTPRQVGITLGLEVGCSAGPPPARAPRPLGCRPLAQRHAFARLLGRLGRTPGRQRLRLRAGVRIHHFIGAQNRLHRLSIPGTGCQRQGREDHRRPHDTHPPPAGRQDSSGWNDDLKARCLCGATRRAHGQVSVAAGMSQLQIENYAQVIGNLPAFLGLGVAAAKHRRVLLPARSCPGGPWRRGQSSSQCEDDSVGMGVWG